MARNYLVLILILLGVAAPQPVAALQDSVKTVRRLAATARLAAEEYRLGVVDGKVVLAPEVEEAELFLAEASRSAAKLPAPWPTDVTAELDRLQGIVASVGEPDSLTQGVERLVMSLAQAFGIELDEIPASAPSLAQGAKVYREVCATCHGLVGRGDGSASAGLDPAPTDLTDRVALQDASPLTFYRKITIGVAGTAMPPYETMLPAADRWAVALYASTLRLPRAKGQVPADLAGFATTAGMSDLAIAEMLGGADPAQVAAVRVGDGEPGARDYGAVFASVRRWADSSFALAAAGRTDEARARALDAYMAFEVVERELRVKDAGLVASLERAFADAREAVSRGGDPGSTRVELARVLERAERAVGVSLSPLALFAQSFIILVREGLEAILVVGALMAFLVKLGAGDRRRDLHLGVGAALAMSLLTAVAIETVFRLSPAHQEALEAVTMVVATVMLFWVSYWLLSKIEVARWSQFVKTRLSEALGRRSSLALASVAFLAVYREGFETVLFYKALVVSGGPGPVGAPILTGVAAGAVVLAAVYVAINRFGVRLPLRPFFALTSAFLYVMAFNFAGTAIAELQEGGFVPLTPVAWLPRVPALGVYPTLESASVQAALLGLALLAVVWTFVLRPRRRMAA